VWNSGLKNEPEGIRTDTSILLGNEQVSIDFLPISSLGQCLNFRFLQIKIFLNKMTLKPSPGSLILCFAKFMFIKIVSKNKSL
jgi:hypothetical protein